MLQQLGIVISAFLGFLIAFYIYYKKSRQEQLVCILGEDCNKVVTSKYSRFLGIRLEVIGMAYYGLIAIYYGVDGAFFQSNFPIVGTAVTGASILAFLLSLYLIAIQLAVLRDLCEWCIASAILSTAIFLLVL